MGIDFTDVSAYLDGELDAERHEAVRKQIESSPVYAEELRRMEQAHSLLKDELDTVSYHDALMAKVQSLDTTVVRERPVVRWAWRGLAAAAAIAVMAAVADYTGLVDLGPGNSGGPSDTVTVSDGAGSPWRLPVSQTIGGLAASGAMDALNGEDVPSLSSLRLVGTVGGERRAALFTDSNGVLMAAAVGVPIIAGAVIADVQYGQAVVEKDGERTLMTVPESDATLDLNGAWQFRLANSDAVMLDCRIRVQGEVVTVTLLDGRSVSTTGSLQGSHVVIPLATDSGTLRFEGDLRGDSERLYLGTVLRENGKTEIVTLEGHRAE